MTAICPDCNHPVVHAMTKGKAVPYNPTPNADGQYAMSTGKDNIRYATRLRPGQLAGARRYHQHFYQPHRATCVRAGRRSA